MKEIRKELIIAILIAIPLTVLLAAAMQRRSNTWFHAPCSHFANYKLGDMPARCIKEYQK